MDDINITIANRLKSAREIAKYTQSEIAELLKIERPTYAQYETGRTVLPTTHLINLCDLLDKSPSYFLGIDDKELKSDEIELLEYYRALPGDLPRQIMLNFMRSSAAMEFNGKEED